MALPLTIRNLRRCCVTSKFTRQTTFQPWRPPRRPSRKRGEFQTAPVHIENTLIALNLLAQSLTAYPGRKNLIWISEAFPLDLFPDMSASGQLNTIKMMKNPSGAGGFPVDNAGAMADVNSQSAATPRKSDTADYTAEVQKVADALMTAQVAVYPIDAAGVGKVSRIYALTTMR